MKKFRVFVDLEKEEKYLSDMAQKGYRLIRFNSLGIYTFEKAEPKDISYKIDYRLFNKKQTFQEYVTLFEDLGWEHVYGTRCSGGQFFIPKSGSADSPDIYSDAESKATRYKRLKNQSISMAFGMMLDAVVVLAIGGFKLSSLAYLTPGLWKKTGAAFWGAFLFETPFVILRFLPFLLLLALSAAYGYWAYQAQRLYRKGIEVTSGED